MGRSDMRVTTDPGYLYLPHISYLDDCVRKALFSNTLRIEGQCGIPNRGQCCISAVTMRPGEEFLYGTLPSACQVCDTLRLRTAALVAVLDRTLRVPAVAS